MNFRNEIKGRRKKKFFISVSFYDFVSAVLLVTRSMKKRVWETIKSAAEDNKNSLIGISAVMDWRLTHRPIVTSLEPYIKWKGKFKKLREWIARPHSAYRIGKFTCCLHIICPKFESLLWLFFLARHRFNWFCVLRSKLLLLFDSQKKLNSHLTYLIPHWKS